MHSLGFVRLALAFALLSMASTATAQSVDDPALPPLPLPPGAIVEQPAPTAPPLDAPTPAPIPRAPDGYGLPSDAAPPYAPQPAGAFYVRMPSEAPAPPLALAPTSPSCWNPDLNLMAGQPRDKDRALGRCRRATGEIVELYITAGMFGAFSASLFDLSTDGFGYTILFLGPSAALGIVAALDLTVGFKGGVPGSAATGFALGALEFTFISSLALSDDAWDQGPSFPAMWASSLAGGLALGLLASQTNPTRAEVSLLRSGAIWGGWLGLMSAFVVGPLESREFAAVTLGGMNVGLALALLATATLPLTRGQILGLDLGGLGGSFLGLLAGLSVRGTSRSGGRNATMPLLVGLGAVSGMIVGALIGKPYPSTPDEAYARGLAFDAMPYVEPRLEGGFTAGLMIAM